MAVSRPVIGPASNLAFLGIAELVHRCVLAPQAIGGAPGDVVFADSGWQDYSAIDASQATKQEVVGELTHLLSLYGTSTLTAYFGMTRVGLLKAGDTVVVSAAGGSVGTAVGQIARALGARVVGIAGGAAKCAWLLEEIGFDAAIDYKAGDVREGLKIAAPEGIDLYFDNVGGQILELSVRDGRRRTRGMLRRGQRL